ncbi:MAG: guanylate kinase [Candidatus Omnitrophota bacterium]|jgi:guanylate kinase
MGKRGVIFVISGPSGSGKTTLTERVLKDAVLRRKLARSISVTTRPRRTGEKNGRDYFFVSKNEFRRRMKEKKILEWTRYLGYYYGTPKEFVDEQLRKKRSVVFCLDSRGAKQLKKIYPGDTVTIFVRPSSIDTLPERIRKRCKQTQEKEVKKRIRLAGREIRESRRYDYSVLNDDFTQALKDLKKIVMKEIQV